MLSVLIVNWNTREHLRKCLASLRNYPPSTPIEVIVVDNDSSDGSAEMVRNEFSWVELITPGKNTGYAKGNNLAFAEAEGEFLLTLNPDTEFSDDSLDTALRSLQMRPDYGCLGIRQILPDGTTQRSVRGFPTLWNLFGETTGLSKLAPNSGLASYSLPNFDYESAGPAPQPMGTFLLFRRSALAQAADPRAPFDTDFPIFFNEVDLLKRLHDAGFPCWYEPKARVLHHHGQSTRQRRKSMIWESHRSLLRYLDKHTRGPARILLPLAGLVILVGAFARARGYHAGFRP